MIKSITTASLLIGLAFNSFGQKNNAQQLSQLSAKLNQSQISFTQNKGQVSNQNLEARPDVLFSGKVQNLTFHLKNDGISYQLKRIDSYKEIASGKQANKKNKLKVTDKATIYRVDINWVNANKNAEVKTEKELAAVDIYYVNNEAKTAKSFEVVKYTSLYNGIDLKWYQKDGNLKYDYLCQAGANYKNIQLQVNGAQHLFIDSKGNLNIKTPLGTIIEKAPVVFQNGKTLPSQWILNKNTISFQIEQLNLNLPYVIDPAIRSWGTYYGGSGIDVGQTITIDAAGDIYIAGFTDSNNGTSMATTGSHQATISAFSDAFLAKFSSAGVRLWSTYYGGNESDFGYGVTTDAGNNVYLVGTTSSSINIATSVSHQSVIAPQASATMSPNSDGFVVKFNSMGVRLWGTYYGGTAGEDIFACDMDPAGDLVISGTTGSSNGTAIATIGSHQATIGGQSDAFVAKFTAQGIRQWGTYYGGTNGDGAISVSTDASNNIILLGSTNSNNNSLVTVGCHQSANAGFSDCFLVKFNASGIRQWATYYGGADDDYATSCATDANSNIFIGGSTGSTAGIATATGHQTVNLNFSFDGFLVKFDPTGARQWGTYYGGDDFDEAYGVATDPAGDVYLTGKTSSTLTSVIATPGSQQTSLLGAAFSSNAYLVRFTTAGVRVYGTYYGSDNGIGMACASNSAAVIYMVGSTGTSSSNVIASSSAHQTVYGGNDDGFLACFIDCNASSPLNATSASNQVICAGSSATLSATGATPTINWYANATGGSSLGTGTTFVTQQLNTAGTFSLYAEGGSCGGTPVRTAITVTVKPNPIITASNGATCPGQSFTIVPAGAVTYSLLDNSTLIPYTSNMVVTSANSATYIVAGTGSNGCTSKLIGELAVVFVTVTPANISVNSGTICSGAAFTLVPSGGVTYTFQNNSSIVNPTTSTNYTVAGTDNTGCTGIATASVLVETSPQITVNSGEICQGSSFTVVPSGASSYTIQGGKAVVSPTATTIYTVTGKSAAGCVVVTTASCTIKVNLPPKARFQSVITAPSNARNDRSVDRDRVDIDIDFDISITLQPQSSFAEYTSNGGGHMVFVYPHSEAFTYTLTFVDVKTGCSATYPLLVLPGEDLTKNWVFPNFISPNGDGKNDNWQPSYKGITATNINDQQGINKFNTYFEGMRLIEKISIVNSLKPELVYFEYRDPLYSGGLINWTNVQEQITTATFCTYIVKFEEGKTVTGYIGVDPKSTK